MDPTPFLNWAHDSWLGALPRQLGWLYTAGLIVHFIGLCILIGAMLLVDLRLLGLLRQIKLSSALAFLPWAIFGFALNLSTGLMFFAFDPFVLWVNPAFKVKMALILLAGCNVAWFTLVEQPKLVRSIRSGDDVDLPIRISAGLSLGLWLAVIVAGRMIVAYR